MRLKAALATFVIKYSKIKWFDLNRNVKRHPISAINDSKISDNDVIVACDVRTPMDVAKLSSHKGKNFI